MQVWYHCMPIFAELRQKSVTIATSVERPRKQGGLVMTAHVCIYPENVVKIGPSLSAIIDL